jgi:glucokinase
MRSASAKFVLGLDLGGTKIAAGVVESSGKLLSAVRVSTPALGVKRDLAALFDAAHSAVAAAQASWRAIRAIGVGVPGAFDPVTETVWAPNLPGWKKVPLKRLLQRTLRRSVFVEGDRNVQALAEIWLGRKGKKPLRNLVFLTVGTGIGAGIIVEGQVVSGTRGLAGAAGWLTIDGNWRPEFAQIGCLEFLASGPAVARQAQEALRAGAPSSLKALNAARGANVTAEMVVEAARRGDLEARRILEETGENLGRGVANLVSLLNPEVVSLGGGLAGAGKLILAPLARAARKWGQPLASRQVRIVRSRLGENAGILGAARYALLKLEEAD